MTPSLGDLVLNATAPFAFRVLDFLDFGEARLVGLLCDYRCWFRSRSQRVIGEDSALDFDDDEPMREEKSTDKVVTHLAATDIELDGGDMTGPGCLMGQEEFYRYLVERLARRTPKRVQALMEKRLAELVDTNVMGQRAYGAFRRRFYAPSIFDSYCHSCGVLLNQVQKANLAERSMAKLRGRLRTFLKERASLREALRQHGIRELDREDTESKILIDTYLGGESGNLATRPLTVELGKNYAILSKLPRDLADQLKRNPRLPQVAFPTCASCEFRVTEPEEDNSPVWESLPTMVELVGEANQEKLVWWDSDEIHPTDGDERPQPVKRSRLIIRDRLPHPLQVFDRLFEEDRPLVMTLGLPFLKESNVEALAQMTNQPDSSLLDHIIQNGFHIIAKKNIEPLQNPFSLRFKSYKAHGGLTYDPFRYISAMTVYRLAANCVRRFVRSHLTAILARYVGPSFVISFACQLTDRAKHDLPYDRDPGGNRLIASVALHLATDLDIISSGHSPVPVYDLLAREEFNRLVECNSHGGLRTVNPSQIPCPVVRQVPIYEILKSLRRVIGTLQRYKMIETHPTWRRLERRIEHYLDTFRVLDEDGLGRDYMTLVEHALGLDRLGERFTGEYIDEYVLRRTEGIQPKKTTYGEVERETVDVDGEISKIEEEEAQSVDEESVSGDRAMSGIPTPTPLGEEARRGCFIGDAEDYRKVEELFRIYCVRAPVKIYGRPEEFKAKLEKVYEEEHRLEHRRSLLWQERRDREIEVEQERKKRELQDPSRNVP